MSSIIHLGQPRVTMKVLRKDRRLPLESNIITIIIVIIIHSVGLSLEIRWTFVFMRILIL